MSPRRAESKTLWLRAFYLPNLASQEMPLPQAFTARCPIIRVISRVCKCRAELEPTNSSGDLYFLWEKKK